MKISCCQVANMVITSRNLRCVIMRNSCFSLLALPHHSWFSRASYCPGKPWKQKRSILKCSIPSMTTTPSTYQPWRRSQSSACRREQLSMGLLLSQHPGPWNFAHQAVDRYGLDQEPRMHWNIQERSRTDKDR